MALILVNTHPLLVGSCYLVSVPDRIAVDLDKYKHDFFAWLSDGGAGHGCRRRPDLGVKVYYHNGHEELTGAAAFVGWLNDFVLTDADERAVVMPRVDFD